MPPPSSRHRAPCGYAIYARLERTYAALIVGMAARSVVMVAIALAIIIVAGHGFGHVATGFLPVEKQGYLLASVQLPDGASLGRT